MKRFRRILQSLSTEILPTNEAYDICDGITRIIANNVIEEILCYAPWCRADYFGMNLMNSRYIQALIGVLK
jgi:hypothetical protein